MNRLTRMMLVLLVATTAAGCFAVPQKEESISDVSALAMAGNPMTPELVAALPPEAWGGVSLSSVWYDLVRTVQIDTSAPDGSGHFLDISSGTDAQKGLEARISDNQRSQTNFATLADVFRAGVEAATRSAGGVGPPQPAPPAEPVEEPEQDPTMRAILEALQDLSVRVDAMESPDTEDGG